jgi:hypothetical protein
MLHAKQILRGGAAPSNLTGPKLGAPAHREQVGVGAKLEEQVTQVAAAAGKRTANEEYADAW